MREQPRRDQSLPNPKLGLPVPGKEKVHATLLAEKTKKGGWRARHEPSGFEGPVQDSHKVPAAKKPGDSIELLVASLDEIKKIMNFKAI